MIVLTPAALPAGGARCPACRRGIALWPWCLRLVAAAARQAAGDARSRVTGSILLVTLATQSLVLLCGGRTGPG